MDNAKLMLKDQLDSDIKKAMLGGDKQTALVLRSLKSEIRNAEINTQSDLDDAAILKILSKESKKRQEAADLFMQGGASDRAENERAEKKIIDAYLPEQLQESEIQALIDNVCAEIGEVSVKDMGRIIGSVNKQAAGRADGALVAKLVKQKIA